MSLKTQTSRQLIKRSTVTGATPTIPSGSTNHTDGTWTVDNIYPGEFYWNMADRKLFLGSEYSGVTNVELIYDFSATSSTLTGGTFNSGTGTLTLNNSNSTSVQVTGFTSGGSFTGGSGNCITDLYLTNMYGCSPITIWDTFILQSGVTINSFNSGATITMDDTLGASQLFLDVANGVGGDTLIHLEESGTLGIKTDDGNDFCEINLLPFSIDNIITYAGGYSYNKQSLFSTPNLISTETITDTTNTIFNETSLDTVTGDLLYRVVLTDASPQSSFSITKDDITINLAGVVQSNIEMGAIVNDVDIRSRINTNNEQSYHLQSYKSSTGLYQQIMVTESTPNDTSARVNLQTPNTGASILTMGMASGTTYSQMNFGPALPGAPTAYADIRVSGTSEGYIEVRENLITISPNLLVTNTITATTISATTYQNLPSSTTTLYKQITANTTTTNLTYTDVAGLAISASTTGVYEISALLLTGSDTAAGMRIGMSVPASSTDFYYGVIGTNSSAANQTQVEGAASGSLVTTFTSNSVANQTGVTKIDGIVTTTQSGEIKIGFAKITSGTATIRAGSYIRITKIA